MVPELALELSQQRLQPTLASVSGLRASAQAHLEGVASSCLRVPGQKRSRARVYPVAVGTAVRRRTCPSSGVYLDAQEDASLERSCLE
jgi:hypothetical protein